MISKDDLQKFYDNEGSSSQEELYITVAHAIRRMRTLQDMIIGYSMRTRVLDVGCFNGVYSKWLAKESTFVVGIDLSKDKIEKCPKLNNAVFIQMDWDNLTFAEDSFDVVLLTECLEHAIDPQKLIDDCIKVGHVVVGSVPLHEHLPSDPLTKAGNGHLHVFDRQGVEKLAAKYTLEVYKEDEDHAYFIIHDKR